MLRVKTGVDRCVRAPVGGIAAVCSYSRFRDFRVTA
jgi:hypothetical protein